MQQILQLLHAFVTKHTLSHCAIMYAFCVHAGNLVAWILAIAHCKISLLIVQYQPLGLGMCRHTEKLSTKLTFETITIYSSTLFLGMVTMNMANKFRDHLRATLYQP